VLNVKNISYICGNCTNNNNIKKDIMNEELEKVEKLIRDSLVDFMNLSFEGKKIELKGNLVFPAYRNDDKECIGEIRISEQEAKVLFLQHIKQDGAFSYSVETPTNETYGKGTRSGNVDVCLYKNGGREHLIEFKAKNPSQDSFSQDFKKLFCDAENLHNYFIHVLEKTKRKRKRENIVKKYNKAIEEVKKEKKSFLKIFLCDMRDESITKYDFGKNGILESVAEYDKSGILLRIRNK